MRARDEREQLVDADDAVPTRLSARGDGDDLLGQHVERVARHHGGLDAPFAHELDDHRALEQVGAELGEDAALARVAHRVPGAPDALQAPGDRLGRLDLQDEVDRAHVDPELQRRGGDQARQLAGLEHLLDHGALLARQRAVVGARDLLLRELVEAQGEALGPAAAVDEDDRRAVRTDLGEQLGVDRRPDRPARRLAAGREVQVGAGRLIGLDHRLDRHVDLEVQRLADAGVDDPRRAPRPHHEAPDLLQRVLRGAEPDALWFVVAELGQALERQCQVRAALGRRDRVDLVDDHRLDPAEHLARLRGEDQVQRLGRRDEDVRRRAAHGGALALRRVAGADRDGDVGADPAQRRAQVAVDVIGERLQRRDVDQPRVRRGLTRQPVEPPQEGGQRLAAARGRGDEHVLAGGDRGPRLLLRGRRGFERTLEPVTDGRSE